MKSVPQVLSLGDRGGCATGPYRTPTTLGHDTNRGNRSSSTYYKETNVGRLSKGGGRDMTQVKEQSKTPEKELNEMEKSNLSDAEFKTLVMRVLKELSEDLSSIKKNSVRNKGFTN